MDTSKIIKGVVNGRNYTVTAPIIKEDYGLYLQIEGVELPPTYQVDFSNSENSGSSVTMIGNSDGVLIPHQFISTGQDVFAFLYWVGADYGKTVYKFRIPNKLRPDRTNEQPTPEEQSVIDQAIGALNEAVAQTAQDVIDADASAQSASTDADRAEDARTGAETAQRKSEEAQESAERAKDDAETSKRNASESELKAKGYAETASAKADAITGLTATATTLPEESQASASYDSETGVMSFGIPKGKDGTNGIDGTSPTASVSKTGKTATITITDKDGTTSARVEDGTDGIDGISPSVSVTDITGGHKVVITDKDGEKSFDVEDGATGATPNLTIGTVETLDPTDDATATITGTPENPVLNLGIPQGGQGEVTLEEFYKAFPTDTASGAVASFTDGADNLPLKSLVISIEPKQDGTGDPSPDNVRPISGWTGVSINACGGKNLLNIDSLINAPSGVMYSGDRAYTFAHVLQLRLKPNTTYRLSTSFAGSSRVLYFNAAATDNVVTATNPRSATTNENGYFKIGLYNRTGIEEFINKTVTVQLEEGTVATDYEPYTGQTIPINFGQTVYSGKLDVLTGKLTVYPEYDSYNGETLTGKWISDRDVYAVGATPAIGAQVVNIGAEGTEIQLEPHDVASLLGVNNIFADTGDTSCEYRADTKLYIEKLTQPEEDDMIADSAITSGQFFMVGNSLYRALANIASGATITVGTNAQRVSLADALNLVNT